MKKNILLQVTLILIFTFSSFLISGCSDDDPVNLPASETLETYWEMHIGADTLMTHHYAFELAVNNGVITGTAQIIDTNDRHSGSVNGNISGNIINATVDFPAAEMYSFKFDGSKNNIMISGKLVFTAPTDAPGDTLDVNLVNTLNNSLNFSEPIPPNPYLFNKVFATPSPTGPPVIFVHGMTGTAKVWDTLLTLLTPEFKSRHNVYVYQYNWQDSVMINGRVLRDSVAANNLVDPILIAHSMGGLVSRAYVASGGPLSKLVTLGTPHLGSALANIVFLVDEFNTPGPKDMKPGGQFITDLKTNALDIANRSKYYCIAGRMGGHYDSTSHTWIWNETYYKETLNGFVCISWQLMKPYGQNDGLVNEWSALFEGGGVNLVPITPMLYVDHMHLTHPRIVPQVVSYVNGL